MIGAGALAPLRPRSRILALCRYYVLMTASLATGLWDALLRGTPATWERRAGAAVVSRAVKRRARRRDREPAAADRVTSPGARGRRDQALRAAGPSIYRQRRVGKGGAEFELLKLRTMVMGAEQMGAGLAVDEGDPRITRVGALLRRWSLDELPNLVNVLNGDMSLVGPRPTVQSQVVAVHAAPASSGSRSGRASPDGRRSAAARRSPGTSASSSTSGTSSTGRCGSTCGSSRARRACCSPARACTGARRAAGAHLRTNSYYPILNSTTSERADRLRVSAATDSRSR